MILYFLRTCSLIKQPLAVASSSSSLQTANRWPASRLCPANQLIEATPAAEENRPKYVRSLLAAPNAAHFIGNNNFRPERRLLGRKRRQLIQSGSTLSSGSFRSVGSLELVNIQK